MTSAVVFVPSGPIDDVFVNQGIAHCTRRDYKVAGLVRGNWPAALAMIAAGLASVIVFARREHRDEKWEPRVEYCGEDTQALFRRAPGPDLAPTRPGRGRPRIVS